MLNRRNFLKGLAAAAAALALDPERALWEPGKRKHFDIHRPTDEEVLMFQNGVSMRFIREFDLKLGQPTRLDVMYGWGAIRPDLAARITG